ncbi:MAG TPA: FAD-binding oxidoreductase, partial [Bacteroidia bacterium]|nr:FAD-binding oxidoreductase [Bacteroidia bacterium]
MKKYTRKQFIKLSSAAGVAFFLNACGLNTNEKKQKEDADYVSSDTNEKIVSKQNTQLQFDLVDKNDERYQELRKGFNKRINKFIALCHSTQAVADAIKYANENKLAIAVKSGGHSMEGFSCNDGGIVINLSKMNKIEMLDDNKIKVGPGCTLAHLYDFILPQGRILPAGSCATVGLGGLTLGGGYGLFSRKYGLTCDHLVEATMVDGKGNIISTKDDAELLWALKGGGAGNFGVVTEMIFNTHPAPDSMQAHYFKARKLSARRAATILQTWMELAPQLPASCFSGYVLNGSTLNIVITNYEVNNKQLQSQLDKLVSVMDDFRSSRIGKLSVMLKNHYGSIKPLYFRNSSAGLFKTYDDVLPFINQVFEKVISTPGMIYQVSTLGGKVNDAEFEKTSSFPHRAFDFVTELQAYWENPSQNKRLAEATTEILKVGERNGVTRQYVNYCSLEFNDW